MQADHKTSVEKNRGATHKVCHKCCQLVLMNMRMVNTYTKIKLNIFPITPCINLDQNMRPFQNDDAMLHTMPSAVPEKMEPQPGQNRFYIFTRFKFGGAFTLQSRLHFAPSAVWLFLSKLKERLAGRKFTRVQDLSKAVRHFRGQRYPCFGVPIIVCSSGVAL